VRVGPRDRQPFARPPDVLDAGRIVLRRQAISDAPAIAAAVRDSLDHLRPWMPWASPEAATLGAQVRRQRELSAQWERGTDFSYSITAPDDDAIRGVIGLHRRIGPGGIEIGYWVHVGYEGRGYASAAARAMTAAAEALPDVDRVEIHTDEANRRSAAIPPKLGYRLDRVDVRLPQAPGETGRLQIWVRP
jgi:RimJ/RimL family protein N-acetyltransferase